MTASGELLSRVAAYGLPGHDGPISDEPLDSSAWHALATQVRAQRLQGFLLVAVDSGVLPATDEREEHARDLHLDACSSVLLLE